MKYEKHTLRSFHFYTGEEQEKRAMSMLRMGKRGVNMLRMGKRGEI